MPKDFCNGKQILNMMEQYDRGENFMDCDNLSTASTSTGSMRHFITSYSGDKVHTCPVCKQKVTGSVEHHMRAHTEEKPFACHFCAKRFALPGNLKAHTLVHWYPERRQFECDVCNEKFAYFHDLKEHKLEHERAAQQEHVCAECGKKFLDAGTLRMHVRGHEEKYFECHICGRIYTKLENLQDHMTEHAKEELLKQKQRQKYDCVVM